jgi:hypothetical protein
MLCAICRNNIRFEDPPMWLGRYIKVGPGGDELTVELIVGYTCHPITFYLTSRETVTGPE